MLSTYELLVLQNYQKKVAAVALSSRLIQPTPANLRDECIAVCVERQNRRDDQILRTFFGPFDDLESCIKAIDRMDIDKFRPLVNFLRRPAIDTDIKNINLLAWLIDFQPRPFELGRRYGPDSEPQPEKTSGPLPEDVEITEEDSPKEPVSEENEKEELNTTITKVSGKPEFYSRKKIIILAVLMFISAGVIIYWGLGQKTSAAVLMGQGKCMYWAGDHYEPVSCDQKPANTLVVALDSEKLKGFRRIMQWDTITFKSKGSVWCVKINGAMEYYTLGGHHPIDTLLPLRPITDYIIYRYILTSN